MKKKYAIVLAIIVSIFVLTGCKDKAVEHADELITDIGEVSLDSEKYILEAENAVGALTANQQEKLDNLQLLIDARETYEILLEESYKEKANSIIEQIEKISFSDDISSEKAALIEDAKFAFDCAIPEVQNLVYNSDTLSQAYEMLESVKEQAWVPCQVCGGSGHETCINCNGSGRVKYYVTAYGEVEGVDYNWGPCTMCDETGHYKCDACNGTGGYYNFDALSSDQ